MSLFLKIKNGYSANGVVINNVVSYKELGNENVLVTYKDPNHNYEMFDIVIKHVEEIKEVKL